MAQDPDLDGLLPRLKLFVFLFTELPQVACQPPAILFCKLVPFANQVDDSVTEDRR